MRYPILYQKNTRFWLAELSTALGREATLFDLPDEQLHQLAKMGFDWLYLYCMWDTSDIVAEMARSQPGLRAEAKALLGEASANTLCASCFAISGYAVPEKWGGQAALKQLHKRLKQHGLRLMLDFIPNHTGIGHPWARMHPDYYIHDTPENHKLNPAAGIEIQTEMGSQILLHGRDPYFPPWSDTLQLNYGNPDLQEAMTGELLGLSDVCEGVRCDMAMLLIPQVFQRTWGVQCEPFWPKVISTVKERHPGFTFLAESYWDLEHELIWQGFDFAYDKKLYDDLVKRQARAIHDQIKTKGRSITQMAHFLENHDEPRAASVFPLEVHQAAAWITFLMPGLRFIHAGQEQGNLFKIPVQFCKPPFEVENAQLVEFYTRLLVRLREITWKPDSWQLCPTSPAWEGNPTWQDFIVFCWLDETNERWLAAIHYASGAGQCYAQIPTSWLRQTEYLFQDRLNGTIYPRNGLEMLSKGLFLDLADWGCHLFHMRESGYPYGAH